MMPRPPRRPAGIVAGAGLAAAALAAFVLAACILAVIALAGPALAQRTPAPRTIEDCERIQAPMAYNDCLSRFGPERGGGGAVRGRGRVRDGGVAPGRGGAAIGRRSNGRKFLIIEPAPRRRR